MGRRISIAAAALYLVVIAGCGVTETSTSGISYPAGASLEQFGLRERCESGGDCSDRAMEAFVAALGRLGPELRNPAITSPGGAPGAAPVPEDRLYVEITADPMLEWEKESGGGASPSYRVDLTDENPYIVVAPRYAFRISAEDAAAIRDALFVER